MIKNNDTAVECSELRKVYRDGLIRRRRFEALKGISFTVRQGEVFGLLGPNGAGKTTFIKILLGIIRKTAGDASLLGYPAGSRDGRKAVGYLPENLRIPRHLNAYTALEYYGNLSNLPSSEVLKRRESALELVGLQDRAKDSVKKYSKGMLQRLGLAQAMLHEPKLLVLDEPTDGLDPRARADVRNILRRLAEEGTTIFLNSHILQEVELVCDRVAILDRGNLRYCGSVNEIESYVRGRREEAASAAATSATGEPEVQLEVTFELAGDDEAIRTTSESAHFIAHERHPSGNHECKLGFQDQQSVDQFIDRLRASQVSIISMNRRHLSLEDAFLEILAEKAD